MARWVGIILVVVLYFVFNKQLESNLIGEKKVDQIKSSKKISFPEIDREILNTIRPTYLVVSKLTEKKNNSAQCFFDMFNGLKCDFSCLEALMNRQGLQLSELVLRDWKKQDPNFNIKNHSDVYVLYHALHIVGLLTGRDQSVEPQYDKAIDIITELSLKSPQNYYPYLFLALIHEQKGEPFEVAKVLHRMDETARYYNNYYSDWLTQLELQSADTSDSLARAYIIGGQIPIPSLVGFASVWKKYSFKKKKLIDAMVLSVEESRKNHPYLLLSPSRVDLATAAFLSKDPQLKVLKNMIFNSELNPFFEKFSSDFPEECERGAVEAWFQKHRSEIQ